METTVFLYCSFGSVFVKTHLQYLGLKITQMVILGASWILKDWETAGYPFVWQVPRLSCYPPEFLLWWSTFGVRGFWIDEEHLPGRLRASWIRCTRPGTWDRSGSPRCLERNEYSCCDSWRHLRLHAYSLQQHTTQWVSVELPLENGFHLSTEQFMSRKGPLTRTGC